MSQDYIVNGQRYTLPDGLSNDEARAKIDNYINEQASEQVDPDVLNAEEPKNESDTYEGFLAEVGEGILSGLINIPTGVVELGAEVVDLAADTSYAKEVHETVEEWKESVGIDPEGMAGTLAEGVVQFGVPGLGAAAAVSKISKLGKIATKFSRGEKVGGFGKAAKYRKRASLTTGERVALGTQQMVAAGVADAVVSTDGTQTIGDFFESGPTTTDKYNVGASGSEDAARRLSNRFSMFVEGGALAGALPPVLSGLGAAFTKATTAKIPVVETSLGELIAAGPNKITRAIGKRVQESKDRFLDQEASPSTFDGFIARTAALLSPAGFLPKAKTVASKETEKYKKFIIREKSLVKGKKGQVLTEQSKTRKTAEGNPVNKRKEFKNRQDAEEYLKNHALSRVTGTAKYKEIKKQIDKIASNKNRVPTDQNRIKDLEGQQKLLEQAEFNRLIDQDYNIVPLNKTRAKKGAEELLERIDLGKEMSILNPIVEGFLKEAEGKFKGLERDIDKILKKPEYVQQTDLTKQKILNTMYEFFNGNEAVTKNINLITPDFAKFAEIGLPKELLKPMKEMVDLKDGLAKDIINSSTVQNLPKIGSKELKAPKAFKENGGYDATQPGTADEQWLEVKRKQGFLIQEDVIDALEKSIMKDDGSTSGFLVRRYRILEDSKYELDAQVTEDVMDMFFDEDTVKGISGAVRTRMNEHVSEVFNQHLEPARTRKAIAERNGLAPEQKDLDDIARLDYQGAAQGINPTREQVKSYIDIVFGNTKSRQKAALRGVGNTYRAPINKVPMSVLNKRKIDIPTLRAIYGEIKNPREAYVSTITQMAQFKGVDNFYSLFRKYVDDDIAKNKTNSIFHNTNTGAGANKFIKTPKGAQSYILGKSSLIKNQIDELAPGETPFGAMHGIAMPSEMWKSMSHIVMNDMNDTGRIARSLYAGFLKLKGYSQYAKTILSPITQVRNVISASLFAVAQGNVGRGANVMESVRLVKNDIMQRYNGDDLAYLVDLQKRGVIGSQAELRELQSNIRRGIGYEAGLDSRTLRGKQEFTDTRASAGDPSEASRFGTKTDPVLLKRLKESNFTGFTGSIDKGIKKGASVVENMYKGGDDIWKIYNYEFELNKLKTARAKHLAKASGNAVEAKRLAKEFDEEWLEGQRIEDFAGDRVRNLVPNYDLTSPLVAGLRKLPVGNFISFPAEIIRTGFNTLDTAMKELSSSIPEIRQIGMRRLMGSLGTFVALPIAVREMAMNLTETSEEEMQAIQNMSAPFQRSSVLLPMGRDKNGHMEVIDFSHTNPYDTLIRPFTALLRSLDNNGKLNKSSVEKVRAASYEAFSTFFEPFLSESIITARVRDVMPVTMYGRGGQTMSGARIFKTGEGGDAFGDQIAKGFIHVVEGLSPGASPFRVPVGSNFNDIEFGRFVRGVGDLGPEPSSGKEYTTSGELLRALTGLNSQSYDPDRLGRFKANEFKQARSTAATLYNREIMKEVTSPEAILDAWTKANNARLRTFRFARQNYLDLQRLGATEQQIIQRMKKENVGNNEIGSIKNNRYIPFFPSRDSFIDAREKGHTIPLDEIRELYQKSLGISLDPVEEIQEESNVQTQEPVQTSEPVVTNTPTTPVVKTSQTSPVARDINTRLATLLNPNDRIIAERQRNIG